MASKKKEGEFCIELSKSLREKLISQAEEEGLDVNDFVEELLAESVVMRAYEIAERRAAQKADSQRSNNNNNNNRNNNRNNKFRRGGGGGKYQNVMDDNASFLEYVRNQER